MLLCCDLGTTQIKAMAVNRTGQPLATSTRSIALLDRPPLGRVQDADEFVSATVETLKECVAKTPQSPKDGVEGIVMSGQQAGLVLLDESGQAMSWYDSWLDTGHRMVLKELPADILERVHANCGSHEGIHLGKLLRFKKLLGQDFEKVAGWTIAAPYVASRLCGTGRDGVYIDVGSIAYSGLIDIASLAWDEALGEAVDLESRIHPKVLEPAEIVGTVQRAMATEIGIVEGCPVFAGIGDFPAAVLGGGIDHGGGLGEVLGTASMIFGTTEHFVTRLPPGLRIGRSATSGVWIVFALIPGGDLIAWARRVLASDAATWLDDNAGAEDADATPRWSRLRDVFFVSLPDEQAAWIGLRADVSSKELMGAVLEGGAFDHQMARDRILGVIGTVPHDAPIRIVGGSGASNQEWMGLKATVAAREVRVRQGADPTLAGTAVLGGVAAGWSDNAAMMASVFADSPLGATYEAIPPDSESQRQTSDRFQRYRKLAAGLVPPIVGDPEP